jgi:broad specificity phosphatase PhoE
MSKAWLDNLPRNSIDCWEDLKEIFTGNFQGTYVWQSNPWDLKGCRQKQGESLQDYIWRFSSKCHELPKIYDADIILVF